MQVAETNLVEPLGNESELLSVVRRAHIVVGRRWEKCARQLFAASKRLRPLRPLRRVIDSGSRYCRRTRRRDDSSSTAKTYRAGSRSPSVPPPPSKPACLARAAAETVHFNNLRHLRCFQRTRRFVRLFALRRVNVLFVDRDRRPGQPPTRHRETSCVTLVRSAKAASRTCRPWREPPRPRTSSLPSYRRCRFRLIRSSRWPAHRQWSPSVMISPAAARCE